MKTFNQIKKEKNTGITHSYDEVQHLTKEELFDIFGMWHEFIIKKVDSETKKDDLSSQDKLFWESTKTIKDEQKKQTTDINLININKLDQTILKDQKNINHSDNNINVPNKVPIKKGNDDTRDILELFENLNNHEIFTPPKISRQIIDLLPQEVFQNPNNKFLDPAVKSGVFLRELFLKLYDYLPNEIIIGFDGNRYDLSKKQERINHILKNMLFGIAISETTAYMSRRTLYGVMKANGDKDEATSKILLPNQLGNKEEKILKQISNLTLNEYYDKRIFLNDVNYNGKNEIEGNIFYPHEELEELINSSEDKEISDKFFPFIDDTNHVKITEVKNGIRFNKKTKREEEMKFDVIIGNPPYQRNDGGGAESTQSAVPLYHYFVLDAIKLNPDYVSLIIPSRWFCTGRGLDDFRKTMLNDHRLQNIVDFPNASECFPSVKIAGGVNYFLWNKNKTSKECVFTNIINGESNTKKIILSENEILVRDMKGLAILDKIKNKTTNFMIDFVSTSKPFGLRTNFKDYQDNFTKGTVKLYGNKFTAYTKIQNISKNIDKINKWKVIAPKTGMGIEEAPYKVIHPAKVIQPNEVCTETYIVIGFYDTQIEAENLLSYYKTKFFRYLISLSKTGQDTAPKVYRFVPLLDMSINWTDQKLYEEYGLTNEEINYINNTIDEMR